MSAHKIYDVVVKTRSYTDRAGEQKGIWQNVGAIWKNADGRSWLALNRWFNPAGIPAEEGRDTISCSLFPPKPQEGP